MKFILSIFLLSWVSLLAETKPHIIYINIDDLGWSDVGVNGSTFYETPNIDKLAKEGMQFTNGYAAASNCAPSRACALTGQNTPRHGVYTVKNSDRGASKDRKLIPIKNTHFLSGDAFTIGHAMQKAGYKTITIGKWHVTKDPTKNGFDINVAGNKFGGPYSGGYNSPFKYPNLEVKEKGVYLTDKLTDEAIRLLKAYKSKPVFLYLPYYMIHAPIQPKLGSVKKYKNKLNTSAQTNAKYAAMVETMDDNIGRLMQFLKDEGLENNTLVVFTSDNGGVSHFSKQTPLRGGKGMYYEGGIREPFFIKWPCVIKSGSISDIPVTNLDLFPTFCEVAGFELPKDKLMDGVSLLPLFKGGTIKKRALYWHFPIYLEAFGDRDVMSEARDLKFRTRPGSVIREGDWKLHQYFEDGGVELYNLKKDIGEKQNLVSKHPEKANELVGKLDKWRKAAKAPVPSEHNPKYETK